MLKELLLFVLLYLAIRFALQILLGDQSVIIDKAVGAFTLGISSFLARFLLN